MRIDILRYGVMSIVEGISVTISQKENTGVSFEQLWASEDERLKLDIYYREAIGDLEQKLTKWVTETSGQFELTDAEEGNYSIDLRMAKYWPTKLSGLLGNKIQDYLAHSIIAGWLNNFPSLEIKADYTTMAASDLNDIHVILLQRIFNFSDIDRADEGNKYTSSNDVEVRSDDKNLQPVSRSAETRTTEHIKTDGLNIQNTTSRKGDSKKDGATTVRSHSDTLMRRKDNAEVCIRRETVDWADFSRETSERFAAEQTLIHHNRSEDEPMSPSVPNRYTPTTEKRWYGTLEEMSEENPSGDIRSEDGVFMDKYLQDHEDEAMQEHDCGRGMMLGPEGQ